MTFSSLGSAVPPVGRRPCEDHEATHVDARGAKDSDRIARRRAGRADVVDQGHAVRQRCSATDCETPRRIEPLPSRAPILWRAALYQ